MGDCTARGKAESKAWAMARYQKRRFLTRALKESKSKNYQYGKDKEDDRRNPIASGRSVCAHGTHPSKTSSPC
jgi:hypothetical protein